MSFNPDPSKQAAEIVFFKNNNTLTPTNSHKHLGMILDSKLNFKNHLSEKISKANKGFGIIRRLYNFLPRASLVNIYRAVVRAHLDYGDIIYDNLCFIPYTLCFIPYTFLYFTHYTSHIIRHTLFFMPYTSYFILHTLHFILYNSHFISRTLYFIPYTSYFIIHQSYFLLHSLYFVLYTSYLILYTLYFTP